jgi:hypothetical protein
MTSLSFVACSVAPHDLSSVLTEGKKWGGVKLYQVHRLIDKFNFESILLGQAFLPCVKDLDKFHEPKLVAFAPPTYVLRVWIESLHICTDRKCG